MVISRLGYGWSKILIIWLAGLTLMVAPLELDIRDSQSLTDAATTTVKNMFSNSTSLNGALNPLLTGYEQLDEDLFTFDEGMLYFTLIQFWKTTGVGSYNSLIKKRLNKARGKNTWERSQNQAVAAWGLAYITAAEMNYPELENAPSWLNLAGNFLAILTQNWDESACSGGLYWDLEGPTKDALSNGLFFQLAARMAYATTGSEQKEYASLAVHTWEWSVRNQILDEKKWSVIMSVNNATEGGACFPDTRWEWSYAYGVYLSGAAYMYKATNGSSWKERVDGLLQSTVKKFFVDNIMTEVGTRGSYGTDEKVHDTMKNMAGLLASSLTDVANLLPETAKKIVPRLRHTAKAAAKQCSGSDNQTVCGSEWTKPTYDGNPSLGSSMGAVNLFTSIMRLPEYGEQKLSDGKIAGIAVGAGAGVSLIATAIFLAVRRHKGKNASDPEYSPCHSDQSQDMMGGIYCPHCGMKTVSEERSELPASKDDGTAALRHELDDNGQSAERLRHEESQEILPHPSSQ